MALENSTLLNQTFNLVSNENQDEYLMAKGCPWIVRKLISLKGTHGAFRLDKTGNEKFTIQLKTPKGDLKYEFCLEKPFEAIGYDGRTHRIVYSFRNKRLIENHEHLEGDRKGEKDDIIEYFIDEDSRLVAESQAKTKSGREVIWRRIYEEVE